jgi:SNF2 family DNA or RNA helicase
MYQKIHNYKVKISAINEMQLTKKQKTDRIGKINEKIEVLVDRIKKLQTRISECNVDPVTLEDIDNPVITECCKQLFNESTIEELYKLNPNVQCPMCRHQLSVIKVVPAISIMPDVPTPKTTLTRLENFKNVVSSIYAKTGLNTKLLIFSEYNKTFELVDNVLKQFPMIYSKYISDAKLLDRYKKRNVNILLLNARSHSAGLNLENTTDIIIYHEMTPEMETQIIGRANRLGRTIGPLNVWKFV